MVFTRSRERSVFGWPQFFIFYVIAPKGREWLLHNRLPNGAGPDCTRLIAHRLRGAAEIRPKRVYRQSVRTECERKTERPETRTEYFCFFNLTPLSPKHTHENPHGTQSGMTVERVFFPPPPVTVLFFTLRIRIEPGASSRLFSLEIPPRFSQNGRSRTIDTPQY